MRNLNQGSTTRLLYNTEKLYKEIRTQQYNEVWVGVDLEPPSSVEGSRLM